MARLTEYSEEEKAHVYRVWLKNDQNVYKTALEVGLPHSTVKSWKDKWLKGQLPVVDDIEQNVDVFLNELEQVRMLALRQLKKMVPESDQKQMSSLVSIVREFTDKIDRVNGLPNTRQEVVHTTTEEQAKLLKDYIEAMRASAVQREDEIIDAEDADIVEQAEPKELNAPEG